MKYYVLFTKKDGSKGVPISMDAMIHEEFDESNPLKPMKRYPWRSVLPKMVELPEELFMICSFEEKIEFDYYYHLSGFIVSEQFLAMLSNSSATGYQYTQLTVKSKSNKTLSDKRYFYLRFYEKINAIDYEKSDFIPELDEDGEIEYYDDGSVSIEKFESLILLGGKVNSLEVFSVDDSIFLPYLFCSIEFKEKIEKANLIGIDIIEIDNAAKHLNLLYPY